MIIPGHTPHWWSELETDIEHLIFRPDPDNRLPHEAQLAEQRLPLRRDLDAVAPDHSVVVVRGGHEYVLNSAGLVLWGITVDTPVPAGGEISRYDDGSLNGKLIDAAKNLVSLDPPPQRDVETRIADQLAEHARLHAAGLTSIRHPGGAPDQYELLAELKRRGELRIRVNFLFRARAARTAEELGAVVDAWPAAQDDGDEWLRVGGVKLGVDGGFEGGWMREPYAEPFGRGGTFHGLQTIPADRFTMAVTELNRRGWRVATHAVGDAAIDQVLAGYEAADAEGAIGGRRWTIEHGFIAAADQLARIRELGLVLSAQLVGDVPDAVGSARNLIYGDDDPDGVDHNVVVRTEADWLRDLEKELPFPRNVEAEGVQIHPVHRPARRPPGDRPPVTRKGHPARRARMAEGGRERPEDARVRNQGAEGRAIQVPRHGGAACLRRGLLLGDGVVPHQGRERSAAQGSPDECRTPPDRARGAGPRLAESHPNGLVRLEGGS